MYALTRLLFALLWIFCLSVTPARAAPDKLVIGITQFPSTFHPNIDAMAAKSYIHAMVARPFTTFDKDWQLVCLLCTELPTIENGMAKTEQTPEGKSGIAVTYAIHPQATWGDGVPVSTRDVLFTWKVGRHERSGVGNIELYRSIYKIDVIDAKSFTLHFDKLTFDYNAINDFILVPAHLEEPHFSEPDKYKNRTAYDTDSLNKGLYFGPYLISEVSPGSHVVLEPNPTWYGKAPAFKRIVVRAIGNTAALEANLLSGGIDMIAGELGLSIDQAVSFEKRHKQAYNVIYKPGLTYEHIDLNLENPLLQDLRVRKALVYAIDRKAISERLFDGRQPVAHTSVNPLDWVYTKQAPQYDYAPQTAARLLDEAGWTVRKGGIRHNAQGDKLAFEIMTTAGNRTRELVEQILQSQWKAAGIEIKIKNEPARVFFGQTMTERRYTGMGMYAWMSSPENVPRTTLHSDHIPTSANNFSGQNYTSFRNPEMDALLEQIELQLDRSKRRELWQRLQVIYAEELPVIPLYFRANAFILPKWLTGVEPTGHQYSTSLWIENWGSR
ncbi:MAG: peptide ABC transporter substrate-binding protein [Rhodospirillales bacterium]|nr:peptide ABC transporter substrate-binding protein [Rhodospirillales bacterium]